MRGRLLSFLFVVVHGGDEPFGGSLELDILRSEKASLQRELSAAGQLLELSQQKVELLMKRVQELEGQTKLTSKYYTRVTEQASAHRKKCATHETRVKELEKRLASYQAHGGCQQDGGGALSAHLESLFEHHVIESSREAEELKDIKDFPGRGGFMLKKGQAIETSWKRRWFRLQRLPSSTAWSLEYFTDKDSTHAPKGRLFLSGASAVLVPELTSTPLYELKVTDASGRQFELRCGSEALCSAWFDNLQKAIAGSVR